MIETTLFAAVTEPSVAQRLATPVVLAAVLGMAAFGFQHGLFLAVLAGMGGLATLLVTLGLAEPVSELLRMVEVPAEHAFPAAVATLAVLGAVSVRFAIGAGVPEGAVRFPPLIDKVAGALVGVLAGMIAAGTLLIVLSTLPLPEPYRIDGSRTWNDLGGRMIKVCARFIAPKADARAILLEGELPAGEAGDGPLSSEPFVDANGNRLFDGDGEAAEKYLDEDNDGSFTPRMVFADANGNGVRDIGLLERYRLNGWQKVRVVYHPVITSANLVEIPAYLKEEQEIYKVTATDLDPGETLTYSLRDPDPDAPAQFAIDAQSGSVTVTGVDGFMRQGKPATIVVVATDPLGLETEKTVTIKYRGPKPRD